MKKALKVICLIINILFLFYIISFFKNGCNINKATIFNLKPSIVISASMQPELNIGDIILLQKADNYKVNDIAAYEKEDKLIVHRIIDIQEDYVYLKGDNNLFADKPVKSEDILYKVI